MVKENGAELYAGHCCMCSAETIGALDGMGNLICNDCKEGELV